MMAKKLVALVCLLSSLFVSASNAAASSGISELLCQLKMLVRDRLPTLALILILLTPFTVGFGLLILLVAYMLHKKNNPEAEVNFKKFRSLPAGLKVGVAAFALGLLLPSIGVLCIIIVVVTPGIMNILVKMIGIADYSVC